LLSTAKINYKNINKSNNYPLEYLHKAFNNPYPNIKHQNTSTIEIEKIIKSLKSINSHGYDKISVKVLKISYHFISSPLYYICNKVLSTGIFATRLKYAQIKPPFKKDVRNIISNNMSISFLTVFLKTFEKVISVRLYQHLNNKNISANMQFGFRPNSSKEKVTFNLISEILLTLNLKKSLVAYIVTFKKAFDSVNHDILLSEMEFHEIRSKMYD
jgi:hypothetical protein